ncbi:unnamed protein product [Trichogramma brassicae]|uniref:Uncharacterized protein n=1 Tax=Trichogramma brassicae TaxID=86971 RepID=A0A6H5I5Z4_9HYME|nr:unnamed protein product [Trichogramma brassicae]
MSKTKMENINCAIQSTTVDVQRKIRFKCTQIQQWARLDDHHLAFGIVRLELDVVVHIENCGSVSGRPQREVVITNCGEIRGVVQTFPALPHPSNREDEQGISNSETPRAPAIPEEPAGDDTVMNELCALVEAEEGTTHPSEPPTTSNNDSDGESSSAEELAAIESAARGLQLLKRSGREENRESSLARSTGTNVSNISDEEDVTQPKKKLRKIDALPGKPEFMRKPL